MSDENKSLTVTDPHRIAPTFVNQIVAAGHLNGVVNLAFATAMFTPSLDGTAVEADMVISSRLRMDLFCAQQLHQHLGQIIEQNTKPGGTKAN